jgi:hypothetical protein
MKRSAGGRDVILLHRLEQGGLRLGRRAVDLVGEQDLREDRSLDEAQAAVAVVLVQDLGAGDVGRHEIRRELDPLERQVQDFRERLDEEGLGEPRDARDEAVAAGEKRHQHLVDDGVLADDDLADLREDAVAAVGDALGDDRESRLVGSVHQCVSE